MTPIPIPKEMVNDDAYLVVELLAEPGAQVTAGQPLAELESSKSAFFIFSPAAGYFLPDFAAGQMAEVGTNFGAIARTLPDRDKISGEPLKKTERDPRFSLPAWKLFTENKLSPEPFSDMEHIRRSDVEKIIAGGGGLRREFDFSALAALPDSKKRTSVVMLGGGGHCRECIEIIELAGERGILGVIDTRSVPGEKIAGYPVIGGNDVLVRLRTLGIMNLVLAYGISGEHAARSGQFEELLSLGHVFPAITHPRAAVSRYAELGRGVQVMAGAMVGSGVRLGDACIVNSNSVVSHDCELASNVHIAPGAMLAGGVKVGRDSVIGMGVTVYMRVRIGEGAVVYNGAHIFADVPDGATVKEEWNGDAGETYFQ